MKPEHHSKEVTFIPSKIYQVSLIGLSFEKDEISFNNKTSNKLQVSFQVTSQPNGQFERPHIITIVELSNEKELVDYSDINGVSFIKTTFLKVAEPQNVVFSSAKYYEFFAAWLKPEKGHLLQEFFVASEPIKQNYGKPAPIIRVQFETINLTSKDDTYFSPHISGLVEWNDDKDVAELLTHPDFSAKAAPLFEEAIDGMEMLLGQLI